MKHFSTPSPALLSRLVLAGIALCSFLPAQYVSIETHSDYIGLCGSPGRRGCALLPTCTAPSSNVLRDDKYTGTVNCDLAGASLGLNDGGSLPLQLQQYNFGQVTPSDTIFTSTDLHFGKGTFSESDHLRHVRFLNQFANAGVHWPRGIGFPDEAIHKPAAVVTTGDDTHYGHDEELGAYRLLYEQGQVNESTSLPVLIGLGNHDLDGSCEFNNCGKRMFDYLAGHVVGGVSSFDTSSENYSWNWNGVHYVQLNKWAGDTQLGSSDTHPSGLSWLINDLRNSVGISNRPVVLFQHFGLDSFSTNGDWWTASDRLAFWNALTGYNVIGLFTGHSHSTGMYDFNDYGGHLDDFVGGTGGEDPCLNKNSSAAPCGGRGNFFAIRVTGNFLDVASLEWVSNTDGSDKSSAPYFTNMSDAVPVPNAYTQGPAFVGGQMGCRKLINSRFVDVSNLVNHVGYTTGSVAPVTVTNTSGLTIPGPVALEFSGLGDFDNLISKSFVDRCAPGGNSFMYPDNGYAGDLKPGASVTFTPAYVGAPPNTTLKLVRAGLTKGASPASVDLTGTPTNVPAPGTITVYGPPNTPFSVTNTIETATANWVSVTPASGSFNQFGIATLTYTLNAAVLLNDKIDATEIAFVKVTTSNPQDEVDVIVTLHLRVSDTITTTIAPSNQLQTNQQAVVTAKITYVPVINQEAGGTYLATGTMTLNEITVPASPVALTHGFLNSNCDSASDPNCPQEPDNTVILPAVTLTPGVHTLQVSYNGDSYYAPNTSAPFQVAVGTPQVSFVTLPGGLQLSLDGTAISTPSTKSLAFLSSHTLAAGGTLNGATGTRYQFSGWDDGVKTASRTISVDQASAKYTALYESQYLLTLTVSPANGGSVTTTDNPADSYYPSKAVETLTATPNAGYYFAGFTGAASSSTNGASITMTSPKAVTANFSALTVPTITWAKPADLLFGSALGPQQLNATASVAGTFAYSPAIGFVPPVGNGFTLRTTFTPSNSNYASATATVQLNVLPAGAATLLVAKTLSRDSSSGNVVVQVTISNTGTAPATNVVLNTARIGSVSGTVLPAAVANVPANGSQVVTFNFPGSVGAPGTSSSLILGGTYSGGTLNYSARIVLP